MRRWRTGCLDTSSGYCNAAQVARRLGKAVSRLVLPRSDSNRVKALGSRGGLYFLSRYRYCHVRLQGLLRGCLARIRT